MINVALLQILPTISQKENLQKGLAYVEKAKKMGADIVLFPEMWNNGYYIKSNFEQLVKEAITLDSQFIKEFQKQAKTLNIAICITFLEKDHNALRNSLALIDCFGKLKLTYAKVHTCDFGDEKVLTAGDDFYVTDLDTPKGVVKCGAMICYDREFPESARLLMLKGAELILVPNACPMEINRLSQLRARAFENMLGIATCNYPKGHPDCNGHSSAFDGVVYLPNLPTSRDTLICEGSENEEICLASFDIEMMRNYRKREVHGNCYRHPQKYHQLIEEPFIRNDYRK